MPASGKFLFDSDVLIRAKNSDYRFNILPAFWNWIDRGHKKGVFFSIDKVRKEISGGNPDTPDPLRDWAKDPARNNFFLPTKATLKHWTKIAQWVDGRSYMPHAKNKFLDNDCADAWLISFAMENDGYAVVTNEVSRPQSRSDVKIPDVAAAMGVRCVSLQEVMARHAGMHLVFKQ